VTKALDVQAEGMVYAVRAELAAGADPAKAAFFPRFFKAGPGEYAAGDRFIGVSVPKQRVIAGKYAPTASLADAETLLHGSFHEERLTALLILVRKFQTEPASRQQIYDLYLSNTGYVNNWDLVDSSAEHIIGAWLEDKDRRVLDRLAASTLIWERRIAILATFRYIKHGEFADTLRIATLLVPDREDLIHKAVGWMLREVGKRDLSAEEAFLAKHYCSMPRTMLRYAIERFSPSRRTAYLKGNV
jgi:3-methyladenine DNA glycosylase AlkD